MVGGVSGITNKGDNPVYTDKNRVQKRGQWSSKLRIIPLPPPLPIFSSSSPFSDKGRTRKGGGWLISDWNLKEGGGRGGGDLPKDIYPPPFPFPF